jgi:predicted transposase YdaD
MIEIFKFIKYDPEKFDFFKLLFAFIAKEDYLSADEVEELFDHYKSQNIKENIMTTTYQTWVNKGLQEGREKGLQEGREKGMEEGIEKGEIKKARLTVLRGRCRGLSIDVLADLSELPLVEVKKLIKGYDKTYNIWSSKQDVKTVEYLTSAEVNYLIDLFNKNQN